MHTSNTLSKLHYIDCQGSKIPRDTEKAEWYPFTPEKGNHLIRQSLNRKKPPRQQSALTQHPNTLAYTSAHQTHTHTHTHTQVSPKTVLVMFPHQHP